MIPFWQIAHRRDPLPVHVLWQKIHAKRAFNQPHKVREHVQKCAPLVPSVNVKILCPKVSGNFLYGIDVLPLGCSLLWGWSLVWSGFGSLLPPSLSLSLGLCTNNVSYSTDCTLERPPIIAPIVRRNLCEKNTWKTTSGEVPTNALSLSLCLPTTLMPRPVQITNHHHHAPLLPSNRVFLVQPRTVQ